MDRDITSGEKLLKLIRKKDRSQNNAVEGAENSSKRFVEKNRANNIDVFKKINKILIFVCLLLVCLIVLIYFIPMRKDLGTDYKNLTNTGNSKDLKIRLIKEKKPFSYYKDVVKEKDVFTLPWESKTNVASEEDSSVDLKNRLKVVGIIMDNDPKVAIEDTKIKQTFFMSVGEQIAEATLTDISEGKVTFSYNGEKIILIP